MKAGLGGCASAAIVSLVLAAGATGAVGDLTFLECDTGSEEVGPTGSDACDLTPDPTEDGSDSGLASVQEMAVSADGRSVYTVDNNDAAVAHFRRQASGLVFEACFTGEEDVGPSGSGACAEAPATTADGEDSGLYDLTGVTLSPDDRSVYVTSSGDQAIARFKRDTETGALTFKGCISGDTEAGPSGSGACAELPLNDSDGDNTGLDSPNSPAVSPNGRWVYVGAASDAAVARFKRDVKTGALTFKSCLTGEVASGPEPMGSGACKPLPTIGPDSGLEGVNTLEASGNGRSLYAGSYGDAALTRFSIKPKSGALTHRGCITGDTDSEDCVEIPSATDGGQASGIGGLDGLAVSPNGESVYAAALIDDSLARFRFAPAKKKLTYKGCITGGLDSAPTDIGGSGACAAFDVVTDGGQDTGIGNPLDVEVSDDGRSVYLAASHDDSVVHFKRKPKTGAVAFVACLTGDTAVSPLGIGACSAIASHTDGGGDSGLDSPRTLAVNPSGRWVYTAASFDAAVATFEREE